VREIMQIISVLSNFFERDINEFLSTRVSNNDNCRAFKVLGYFCYEAYLNKQTQLSLGEIGKFIHCEIHSILRDHKYISDRLKINSLTGSDVRTIHNILDNWRKSQQFK